MGFDARSDRTTKIECSEARAVVTLTRLYLKVAKGPDKDAEAEVLDRILIGRDETCDLRLTDSTVSGEHATLEVASDGIWLTDLGSTNGSRINGVPIERGAVTPGDRIELGSTLLSLESSEESETVLPADEDRLEAMVGRSERMRLLFNVARRIAATDLAVLIQGETGTGKELLAQAIHALSRRREGPFVAVDTASLPDTLAASELFGHEKGAFTGADRQHRGAFERADGGTIFLDEVGELRGPIQSQLLRVLETGRFTRLGGEKLIAVDVRVIAATHRPLQKMAGEGEFRLDLLFRLNQVNLIIPPLRERLEDIALLVEHLKASLLPTVGRDGSPVRFAADALDALRRHSWPGNVRELRNYVGQILALVPGDLITAADLPPFAPTGDGTAGAGGPAGTAANGSKLPSYKEMQVNIIKLALARNNGNKSKAARDLGVPVSTFSDWVKRYGL